MSTFVHIMTGLPASGKTTHARTLPAYRFNLDDYRSMLWGESDWTHVKEHVAVQAMLAGMKSAVADGNDVCLDNTHLVPSLPRLYRKELARLDVEFVVHDFTHVPIHECIDRDAAREHPVGSAVIERLANNHRKAVRGGWKLTSGWMNGERYIPPAPYVEQRGLEHIVICDLDGTIALHGDERGHFEYEKVGADQPNPPVLSLVQHLMSNNHRIVFMSGREDRCRKETEGWLRHWVSGFNWYNPPLFMRKTGDHRPDYIVKGELFDEHIRGKFNVEFCLDDRDQVVRLWRDMGLTCLQVADGDF